MSGTGSDTGAGRIRLTGFIAAAAAFGIDQADKAYMLQVYFPRHPPPVDLGPYLTLERQWNPGISYSLLTDSTPLGRFALLALALVATLALLIWLWRATTMLTGLALGLVIGGAMGNALDRSRFGAVADFFYVHVASFSWYVFNLADCAIVAGAALLLYETLVSPTPRATAR